MPELPEVETMVRGIRPKAEGAVILDFVACKCSCRPLTLKPAFSIQARRAKEQAIVSVGRRGKRVLLQLQNEWMFVIEPRMTGLMLVSNPPDEEHLRLRWDLKRPGGETSVWFWDRRGLGVVSLLSPAEQKEKLGSDRLGPDALEMTPDDWKVLCRGTDRPIKVAMLDQKLVAGIGNLYASEILHRAGVSPKRRSSSLKRAEISRISESSLAILHDAILHEGSTLSDGTYRNALNQSGSYQNSHQVYDREGQPCRRCQVSIIRIVQAQRATFYCPSCQQKK